MKKAFFNSKVKLKSSKPAGSKALKHDLKINFKVLDNPTKSFSDKKEYKVIQLDNGLTACLIADPTDDDDDEVSSMSDETDSDSDSDDETGSDSTGATTAESESEVDEGGTKTNKLSSKGTKLAAAALCIGVGSFSDPKEVPGLAHFLEHMVFMGSEKHPQENDFDSFINKHGGSDNASTDYEVTTFYFECFERHLHTALDKFSQFFISPLMQRDSMTREREAVESEFQMAVPSDDFRKEQLLVSLSKETSPVNSFSWGNLITLKENIDDDKLYEMLHEFRKRHYSAHRMTLAVQARLPIQVLETYVLKCFSAIPNNGTPPDDFKNHSNDIFDTPKFTRLYYIKPVKDVCQVDLTFCLPSLLRKYRTKPHVYVSWILGYQGKKSLLSFLKKKVWALSLYAGNDESGAEFNSIYATFTISLVLTKEGYNNLREVIESVFGYINLLKEIGPSERIFREIQCIEEISFRFEEDETAADNVEDLAENMQYFPPSDYLTGDALIFEYDAEAISMVLNNLVPEKMNIMISSSDLPDHVVYDKIEPWFKTHYTDMDIPSEWLECWSNAKPTSDFAPPEPNPYITTDFTILPKEKHYSDYPEKIMDTPIIELWYRKDEKFDLPLAYYCFYLISPLSLQSASSSCMMEMYAILIMMNLAEEGYDAQLAELEYEVIPCDKGIIIKISGYNEKLHLLAELIGRYLRNVVQLLSEPLFEAVKEKLSKSYYNGFLKPSRLCKDLRLSILQENYFSLLDKHTIVADVTFNMMKEFSETFLKHLYIQALVQGNVSKATALEATNAILQNINTAAVPEDDLPELIINKLPRGEHCCRVLSFNKENSNSIITNYYQCGLSHIKNTVILEFILLVIEEPLFDKLRTKEQLGYKVTCSLRDTYGILGFSVTVNAQAHKHTTEHVDLRIEAFLEHSQKTFKKLTEKKFLQTKKDLIKMKQCIDIDLEDETIRNWEEIVNNKYQFDRLLLEIKVIDELKIEEVKKFWETHNMYNKHESCRKLSMQVVGHSLKKPDEKQLDEEKEPPEIEDSAFVEDRTRHSANYKQSLGQVLVENVDSQNCSSTATKFALQYIENPNEITGNRKSSYFITDIRSFKNQLQPFARDSKS